jgi:hypothetical protein
LPEYIEKLELADFDIGTAIPLIERIGLPIINDWGSWLDIEVGIKFMINFNFVFRSSTKVA